MSDEHINPYSPPSGTREDSKPYAPPISRSVSKKNQVDEELASRFMRLVARIIDGVIQVIVEFPITLYVLELTFFELMFGGTPPNEADGAASAVATLFFVHSEDTYRYLLVSFLIYVCIQFYFLKSRGQTLGKMAVGIRIVDYETGNVPKIQFGLGTREGIQWLFQLVPLLTFFAIIDVLPIFAAQRRCLHDYWAFTKVIKARGHRLDWDRFDDLND